MEVNITELFPTTKYIIRIEAVSMYGRSAEVMCFGTTADYIDVVKDTATSFPASTKLLRTTETVLTTTASPELKISTNTFWLDEDFTTPPKRKDTTAKPRTFMMDQFEITSTAATTDPQLTTDVPKAPTTPSGNGEVDLSTPYRTLSPLQALQRLQNQMDQSNGEAASLENVIGIVTGINNLLRVNTSQSSLTGFTPELEAGIDLLRKSSELIRATEGSTIPMIETLLNAS
ncbi:uncharacterized protein LOC144866257 isoform X2 [Branchiostoma floridae x Branchiostoma japonicum]